MGNRLRSSVNAEEARFKAENDFDTMLTASQITKDSKRHKAAMKIAKDRGEAIAFLNEANTQVPLTKIKKTTVPDTKMPKAKNVRKVKGATGKPA